MKATWILTAVGVLIALSIPVVLGFWYATVQGVQAGSLDYWLGIPDEVKAVPVVSACDTPLYSSTGRDGETPPNSSISYETQASVAHVRAVIEGQFVSGGCTPSENAQNDLSLSCPNGDRVVVTVSQGETCNNVGVVVFHQD